MRAAIAAAILLGAANLAAAPAAPSVWETSPTSEQVRQAKPEGQTAGRAILRCHVEDSGVLSACQTMSEEPAGQGFGQAAQSLMTYYRLKPDAVKTEAPGGQKLMIEAWFPVDKEPSWLRKPSPEDLLVVWPKQAWREGRGGKATISCLINLQGALYDCVVASESPAGQNFGAAAVALTPQFLMHPATLKGQPVVSAVNIPINFIMPSGGGGGGESGRRTAPATMAWPEAPSYADVVAAYPKKAREARISGHATLDCEFAPSGHLSQCHTIAEEPKGQGFADAAKLLTKKFRAVATLPDGKSISGIGVQLPFAFDAAILGDDKPAIGKPQWASLPSAEDTRAAFDTVVKSAAVVVHVTLTCTVQPGGGVADCKVTREDPTGQGVGAAALALAPRFQVSTWSMEGLPTVGGLLNIPLRYEPEAKPAPAARP